MESYFTSEELAQSVPIHHYEKWIDVEFKHKMASFFEVRLKADEEQGENTFCSIVSNFAISLTKEANSLVIDLAIQQHSTTSFSLAQYTLRNCLIYTLTRDLPYINRSLDNSISEWERKQIWTVNLPNLAASLQMLYEHEKRLPCILHVKDIQEKFNDYFNEFY